MSASQQIAPRFKWTEAAVDQLKALSAKGASCARIAKALTVDGVGPSRSAVIGKLDRLGVDHGRSGALRAAQAGRQAAIAKRDRDVRPQAERKPPPSKWRPYVADLGDPQPPGELLAEQHRARFVAEASADAPASAKRIDELPLSACRWPVGQRDSVHVFCGRRSDTPFAYCAAHAALRSSGRPLAEMKSEADNPFKRERRRA